MQVRRLLALVLFLPADGGAAVRVGVAARAPLAHAELRVFREIMEIELEVEAGAEAVLAAVTGRLASAGVRMREERKGKFSRFLTHAGIR